MNPVVNPHDPAWISGRQACRILGCAPSALQRAVMFGYIRVRLAEGETPRYHGADVERHARSRSEPASSDVLSARAKRNPGARNAGASVNARESPLRAAGQTPVLEDGPSMGNGTPQPARGQVDQSAVSEPKKARVR
jgi:hypothetical protein